MRKMRRISESTGMGRERSKVAVFHILLIEDDPDIRRIIVEALQDEYYEVDVVGKGWDGILRLKQKEYHAIILDLMLPDLDGMDVLRHIRESRNVPVLILTAKEEETHLVAGLGMGADDYMTKPFGVAELKARLQAQVRRYLYLNAKSDQPEASSITVHSTPNRKTTFSFSLRSVGSS